MMPSQEDFLVRYLGQNTYKIFFSETSKIKYPKNDEISLIKDQDLFYYLDLNSENTLTITNENIL